MNFYKLYHGDCLDITSTLDDECVNSAILDPPYNIGIADWDKIDNYIPWLKTRLIETQRVLKDNGTMWFFHNNFITLTKIQNMIEKETKFKFKQFITVNKGLQSIVGRTSDALRSYPTATEYLLFYTLQDDTGLTTVKLDMNNFSNLRQYFKNYQEALGLNKKQLMVQIGQKVDHCFRWGSSQWDIPTKETYEALQKLPLKTNFIVKDYDFIRRTYDDLRQEYDALRYTFNLQKGITDVWDIDFYKDRIPWHPTSKPVELIKRIIKTSTNKDDVVFDPFLGSGSTLKASQDLSRSCIGIELDHKYIKKIKQRCWGRQFLDRQVEYDFIQKRESKTDEK